MLQKVGFDTTHELSVAPKEGTVHVLSGRGKAQVMFVYVKGVDQRNYRRTF